MTTQTHDLGNNIKAEHTQNADGTESMVIRDFDGKMEVELTDASLKLLRDIIKGRSSRQPSDECGHPPNCF